MFLINLNDFISNLKSTKYVENMIKIFKCTILDLNSGDLHPKSDEKNNI